MAILKLECDNIENLVNGETLNLHMTDDTNTHLTFEYVTFYHSLTDNSAPFKSYPFQGIDVQIRFYRDYTTKKLVFEMVAALPFSPINQRIEWIEEVVTNVVDEIRILQERTAATEKAIADASVTTSPFTDITPNAVMTWNATKKQYEHSFNTATMNTGDILQMAIDFEGHKSMVIPKIYATENDALVAESGFDGKVYNFPLNGHIFQFMVWIEIGSAGNGKFVIRDYANTFSGTGHIEMTHYLHIGASQQTSTASASTAPTSQIETITAGLSYEAFWASGTQAYKQMHTDIDWTDFQTCYDNGLVEAAIGVYGQGNERLSDVTLYESWKAAQQTWGINAGQQHNVLGSPPAAIAGVMQPYNNNGKLSFNTYVEVRPVTGHNTSRYITYGRVRMVKY